MAKLESTFKNMVLSLVIISMVAAGALAGVYVLTAEAIDRQEAQKQQAAILAVLPEGCTLAEPEQVDGMTLYKAYSNDEWVATAVETSEVGFDGPQVIMVGLDAQGTVLDYVVLKQTETPGLGAHITHWFKNADKPGQSIIGRKAGEFTVSKDGGDVDAITAATISSRAFLKAVNKAYSAAIGEEVDTASGATTHQPVEEEVVEIVEETEVSHE
ncbi:MAG: RnfABCDGE type electron transport complex subunit G [Paludibacteraceae bacterium]|nr:RnfABCDGE type electron transport complex subunit G [Paludibacteraceae bacterium]